MKETKANTIHVDYFLFLPLREQREVKLTWFERLVNWLNVLKANIINTLTSILLGVEQ